MTSALSLHCGHFMCFPKIEKGLLLSKNSAYSFELPRPNRLSKLVNKLKIDTNKLTVANT